MAGIVAVNYADALFTLAKEENLLDAFKASLENMDETLYASVELSNAMKHPKITKSDKKQLLDEIFNGNDKYVVNFAKLLVDKSRFSAFHEIVKCFITMYNEYNNIEVAYVQSAVALSKEQEASIQAMLEKKSGKHVELKTCINKELLAGIRIKIKDEILDNSAATRLERMKEQVVKTTLQKSEVA